MKRFGFNIFSWFAELKAKQKYRICAQKCRKIMEEESLSDVVREKFGDITADLYHLFEKGNADKVPKHNTFYRHLYGIQADVCQKLKREMKKPILKKIG